MNEPVKEMESHQQNQRNIPCRQNRQKEAGFIHDLSALCFSGYSGYFYFLPSLFFPLCLLPRLILFVEEEKSIKVLMLLYQKGKQQFMKIG